MNTPSFDIWQIQNSNILLKIMIDKDAFDKQINSIRSRYNRLCNPKVPQSPNITSFNSPEFKTPFEEKDNFATPIRIIKNIDFEEDISFSKLPEPSHTSIGIDIQALSLKYEKLRKESNPKYTSNERTCLTARQNSSKKYSNKEDISEKQEKLLKRVKDNENLLKISQELRQGSARCMSATKPQKQEINQEELFNFRSKNSAMADQIAKRNMQLRKNLEKSAKENIFEKKVITDKLGKIKKEQDPLKNAKNNINREYTEARTALNQKMNQILENFKTKTPQKVENQQKPKNIEPISISERITQLPQKTIPEMKFEDVKKYTSIPKEDLKVVSVFQNTKKVEERIKAILFYP